MSARAGVVLLPVGHSCHPPAAGPPRVAAQRQPVSTAGPGPAAAGSRPGSRPRPRCPEGRGRLCGSEPAPCQPWGLGTRQGWELPKAGSALREVLRSSTACRCRCGGHSSPTRSSREVETSWSWPACCAFEIKHIVHGGTLQLRAGGLRLRPPSHCTELGARTLKMTRPLPHPCLLSWRACPRPLSTSRAAGYVSRARSRSLPSCRKLSVPPGPRLTGANICQPQRRISFRTPMFAARTESMS